MMILINQATILLIWRIMKKIIQLVPSDIPETREEILKDQDGVCAICKKDPKRPVLDHSHAKRNKGTGLVRGVLCSNCNVFLAKIENNCTRYGIQNIQLPDILDNISTYLVQKHYPYKHPSERKMPLRLMKSSYNELSRKNKTRTPPYRNGMWSTRLKALFKHNNIEPKFYKD